MDIKMEIAIWLNARLVCWKKGRLTICDTSHEKRNSSGTNHIIRETHEISFEVIELFKVALFQTLDIIRKLFS